MYSAGWFDRPISLTIDARVEEDFNRDMLGIAPDRSGKRKPATNAMKAQRQAKNRAAKRARKMNRSRK
ncbi:hypothetical protein [Neptuniibacter sp. QD37_11]|uniref:hypothetical protein n=1 Tax=Neptuniibacter sp. QD37_11 TaxID=3398209 RepID=UPI0039F624A1